MLRAPTLRLAGVVMWAMKHLRAYLAHLLRNLDPFRARVFCPQTTPCSSRSCMVPPLSPRGSRRRKPASLLSGYSSSSFGAAYQRSFTLEPPWQGLYLPTPRLMVFIVTLAVSLIVSSFVSLSGLCVSLMLRYYRKHGAAKAISCTVFRLRYTTYWPLS